MNGDQEIHIHVRHAPYVPPILVLIGLMMVGGLSVATFQFAAEYIRPLTCFLIVPAVAWKLFGARMRRIAGRAAVAAMVVASSALSVGFARYSDARYADYQAQLREERQAYRPEDHGPSCRANLEDFLAGRERRNGGMASFFSVCNEFYTPEQNAEICRKHGPTGPRPQWEWAACSRFAARDRP